MEGNSEAVPGLVGRSQAAAEAHAKDSHSQQQEGQEGLLGRSRAAAQTEQPAHDQAGKGHHQGQEEQRAENPREESWLEWVTRMRQGGNDSANQDGYERARERSLPDEQKEEKDRGR